MVEVLIRSVGPGRDFETLAEFALALPPSLVAVDQRWIALVSSESEDPGGAVFRTACDSTRFVEVRAAPGEGFDDFLDADADPLAVTPGQGALIRTTAGNAITAELAETLVHLKSLQIVAENGAGLADDGAGAIHAVDRCLIEADGSGAAATLRGSNACISNSVVIQNGGGDGIALANGAAAKSCSIAKPPKDVADGFGITGSGLPLPTVDACFAFGFRQAFDETIPAADRLVSDQTNYLSVADNLADPYWIKISSTVDSLNTVPGPYNVPLQWTGNNLNSFARFQSSVGKTVDPGQTIAFSAIIAQPTTLVSALLFTSAIGSPELRVNWTTTPPTVNLFGQSSALMTTNGTVTDLGNSTYRLLLEATNTSASSELATPILYVTRGIENAGLQVGMYAGNLMSGCGNLGNGFVHANALPGTNAQDGIHPEDAVVSYGFSLDLRPVVTGSLEGSGTPVSATDTYFRVRNAPDTIGAASLNTGPLVRPEAGRSALNFDAARLIDANDILTAQRDRTVLPASQSRRVGV
ncbi:MAG: hypothetical protein AAF557_07100 [Pseudomonadota bacterium]